MAQNSSRQMISLGLLMLILFSSIKTRCCMVGERHVGKFGSVRVFFDPAEVSGTNKWGNSWPEGIKLVNNLHQQFATNHPSISPRYHNSSSTISSSTARRIAPVRRTYNWQGEELIISFVMTGITDPTCSRLVPPITWLSSPRAKVKVLHSGILTKPTKLAIDVTDYEEKGRKRSLSREKDMSSASSSSPAASSSAAADDLNDDKDNDDDSVGSSSSSIQIIVPREFAENSLRTLRMHGFTRQDIYRMLDKGPWVLAFDMFEALPRLFRGLQTDLQFTRSQAVHVVSHCPYLIAQYARYKGRDVFTTFRALVDAGCNKDKLKEDILRFPSMLAAPPERISGWSNLLHCFDIAKGRGLFGKLLRRAPFMYYLNPPLVHDDSPLSDHEIQYDNVSTTASSFVAYESLRVLQFLREQDYPDLDKIVRTQPLILLANKEEVTARAEFLFDLFMETLPLPSSSLPPSSSSSASVSQPINQLIITPDNDDSGGDFPINGINNDQNSLQPKRTLHTLRKPLKSSMGVMGRNSQYGRTATSVALHGSGDIGSTIAVQNMDIPTVNLTPTSSATMNSVSSRSSSSMDYLMPSSQSVLDPYSKEEGSQEEDIDFQSQYMQQIQQQSRQRAKEQLGALLLTYPAVLSIGHQQMRAAGNALRKTGMKRWEVVQIARRHPPILGREPSALIELISFLRYHCGMKKIDLLTFLNKYPFVLAAKVEDIEPKVDYLFQSLGGSQEMLRRFPAFLSFDLELHTRPRAEFLRAMGIDPLVYGLGFLVVAPAVEIAELAGVSVALFRQFQTTYEHIRKEKEKDIVSESSSSRQRSKEREKIYRDTMENIPEEGLLDEFDVGF